MTERDARSFVIHGEMPERFRHHLAEAIDALGYYRADALDQLLGMYRTEWPKGLSSTLFRTADILPLLTAKGLADPGHAQKAIFLRSHFNLQREEFDSKLPEGVTGLMFWARATWLCDEARLRDQAEIRVSQKWLLPMESCSQEWCPCHWTWSFNLD